MGRREFLELCGLLGVGAGLGASGAGCRFADEGPRSDRGGPVSIGSVVVVGAGAAGLTAAHWLVRHGVDVMVLEASTVHGGRMKRDAGFVDFPVPLGAEWLHIGPEFLGEITGDETVELATELAAYRPDELLGVYDGQLTFEPLGEQTDLKFVGSTWLDVFDEYVVPTIADRIRLGARVAEIDHSGDRVLVTEASGETHVADAVVVTVPPTILRDGDIVFRPDLPMPLRTALGAVDVWGGLKVFVEFSDRFYPTALVLPDSVTSSGQHLYYDAAHGQRTSTNLLGLFAVGTGADRYRSAEGPGLLGAVLTELDEIFDGAASRSYIGHIAQDWELEPFIRQAYVAESADWRTVRTLGTPFAERVVLAGDSYTDGSDWSSVHVAVRSARAVVDRLLEPRR